MQAMMKTAAIVAMSMAIGCSSTAATTPAVAQEPQRPAVVTAGAPPAPIRAELKRLEESKWDPASAADREAFMALFADDFVSVEYGTDVQGGVHRRTRADVFSGPPAPASRFELSDWHAIEADDNVVILSYHVNGLSFPWHAYATSVWTLRNGKWQTVFYQASTAE